MPHNPTAYDDDWEDQPGQGPFYKWALGIALPLAICTYGVYVTMTRHATLRGRVAMTLEGTNAVAFGAATMSLALFLHCHYFWGNLYNQAWFAVIGKIVGLCGLIAGLGTLIVRIGILGKG